MTQQESQLEAASRTDVGYLREENQDCMGEARGPLGHVFIVADGMGGHKGGAYAAKLVVQGLLRHLESAPADAGVEDVVERAFRAVNESIYSQGHSGDPAIEGMGSTAVLLIVSGSTARVAHVGDSRAYLYREERLRQLTTDHTMVQRMVEAGMLKPEEATNHPNSSVLDRALGSREGVMVDISPEIPLADSDAILLCSDGLSGYSDASEIESVLQSEATVQEIPELLVKLALDKGGADNVTVQFIQYGKRRMAPANLAAGRGERVTGELKKRTSATPKPRGRSARRIAIALIIAGLVIAGAAALKIAGKLEEDQKPEHAQKSGVFPKSEGALKGESTLKQGVPLKQGERPRQDVAPKGIPGTQYR